MTSAAVGHRVTEPLSDSAPRFISGQFQPLRMNREFFSAIFFAQALAALSKLIADTAPMRNVIPDLREVICLSESKAIVPQAFLVRLHRPGNRVGRRDRIHAEFIEFVIPVENLLHVMILNTASEKIERLKLRSLDRLTVHTHGTRALDRTGKASLIDDIVLFRKCLAVYIVKILILTFGVVARRKHPAHLHRAYQSCCAHSRQLIAGERMIPQIFKPLFEGFLAFFRLGNRYLFIAARCDRLDILPAENSTHAGSAGSALAADHRRILDQILTRRTDTDASELCFRTKFLLQHLLTGSHFSAPQIIRIMENEFSVLNLDPCALIAFTANDQCVHAGFFQIISECSAAVCRRQKACLRRQRRHIKPARTGRSGTGQRTRRNHNDVFF